MVDLRVELLTFEGCPHLDRARRDLEAVLRESIIETPIQVVYVNSPEDAEFLGFQGSPTIRINGEDIDPQPDLPVGIGCRLYRDDDGRLVGAPPIGRIRAAVEAHRRGRLRDFQRREAGLVASYASEAASAEASDADSRTEAQPGPSAQRPTEPRRRPASSDRQSGKVTDSDRTTEEPRG